MECLGEERCAVVRTRAMQKQDEATQKKDKARATYLKWENSIKTLGQKDPGRNLLNHQSTFSLNLMAYRELLVDAFGPYITDSRFHTHLSAFKNGEATPQEKARFKASNMYVTLSPINLEMVTLRERKVPGEALRQPLRVVPIGKELPPAVKTCEEKQGEKVDELCVL